MLIYFLRFNRHCIRERGETAMKENIHPQYGKSKCHPFYTGKQKLVDTGGRVDRFKKRFNIE